MKLGKKTKIVLMLMIALSLITCALFVDVKKPVELLWDKNSKKTDKLIIFFPGLYDTAEKFKDEEFFSIARKAGITADMVSANVNIFHLAKEMMIERIEMDVFEPAKISGYKNIWLVGVSLGGLSSLLFNIKHEQDICGVVTLAPYVANTPLIEDLSEVKEIKYWQPGSDENKLMLERRLQSLWIWLKDKSLNNDLKNIYLGYGKQDRYVGAIKFFEKILDKNHVVTVEGGHTWVTGQKIWQKQLSTRLKTGLLQPCN
ncbi:MAG: hypothetical protein KAT06_08420 [Gammaproteobacteria bacterium]|nr:hypothetical protein [Gammaproteobacteria bacterium]